jgi:hypothetical protein
MLARLPLREQTIAAAVQLAPPKLPAQEVGRPALMIEIDGAIGPATSNT